MGTGLQHGGHAHHAGGERTGMSRPQPGFALSISAPSQCFWSCFGISCVTYEVKTEDVSIPHKGNRQTIPPLISNDPFVSFQGEVSSVLAQPWCHCYPWGLPGVLCDGRRAISIPGQRDNSHTPGGKDHFLYHLSWTDYINIEHLTKMTGDFISGLTEITSCT